MVIGIQHVVCYFILTCMWLACIRCLLVNAREFCELMACSGSLALDWARAVLAARDRDQLTLFGGARSKGASQKLEELGDHIRLAFSTAQAPAGGGPPGTSGYKVHVHKEKKRGGLLRCMLGQHALLTPALSFVMTAVYAFSAAPCPRKACAQVKLLTSCYICSTHLRRACTGLQ